MNISLLIVRYIFILNFYFEKIEKKKKLCCDVNSVGRSTIILL